MNISVSNRFSYYIPMFICYKLRVTMSQIYLLVGTDALVCPPESPYFFVKYVLLCGQTRASVPTLWRLRNTYPDYTPLGTSPPAEGLGEAFTLPAVQGSLHSPLLSAWGRG